MKIYEKYNGNTNDPLIQNTISMRNKVLKCDGTVQSFRPELESMQQANGDMPDWKQQQDAQEMGDWFLDNLHLCIRIPSVFRDSYEYKMPHETIPQFVERRCRDYYHATDNSIIYDYCAILTIANDICQYCVNCNENQCQCAQNTTTLSRDKSVMLPITKKQSSVSYAMLNIDGTEDTKYVGKMYINDVNIIANNDWKGVLNLIMQQKHPNHQIQIHNNNPKIFRIENMRYIYFITYSVENMHYRQICATIIDSGVPTVQNVVTSNTKVLVIQKCPQNYFFNISLCVSTFYHNRFTGPMTIPFNMFFFKECNLTDILNNICEWIDKNLHIRLNVAWQYVFYTCQYQPARCNEPWNLSSWEFFYGSQSSYINPYRAQSVVQNLKTTPNIIIGIQCAFKYKVCMSVCICAI